MTLTINNRLLFLRRDGTKSYSPVPLAVELFVIIPFHCIENNLDQLQSSVDKAAESPVTLHHIFSYILIYRKWQIYYFVISVSLSDIGFRRVSLDLVATFVFSASENYNLLEK